METATRTSINPNRSHGQAEKDQALGMPTHHRWQKQSNHEKSSHLGAFLKVCSVAKQKALRRLKDSHPGLGGRILALHIVHIARVILALVIVPGHAPKVALAGDTRRAKRTTTTKPVALGVGDVVATVVVGAPTDDAAVVGDAGTGILGDNGGGIAVGAAFATVPTARNGGAEGAWGTEDGETRRVGCLRAERLHVGGNVAKGIMCAIEAGVEARWGS